MFKKMKTHKSNLRTDGHNDHQCLHLSKLALNDQTTMTLNLLHNCNFVFE
jgi:hypothetical protein